MLIFTFFNLRFSGLELFYLMHAALKRTSPNADSGGILGGLDGGADDVLGEEEIGSWQTPFNIHPLS